MDELGLYIHIPFCVKKCAYCDFLSFGGCSCGEVAAYVKALCKEIEVVGKEVKDNYEEPLISTLYIGGGTPSVLDEQLFGQLMKEVHKSFCFVSGAEMTIEINPGTVTNTKIDTYIAAGINRVSMGLQSSDDDELKELGRIHSYATFLETYHLLESKGITNISVDLMFGLSGHTLDGWHKTLDKVIELNPKHISAYSLIIEPGTEFEEREDKGLLDLPDEETERQMFWDCHNLLEEADYEHYETSNYGKKGYHSKHNSGYWEMKPYIGVGLGASSYYDCGEGLGRYKNIANLKEYIDSDGNVDILRRNEQRNTPEVDLEEAFFLGLRKLDGVSIENMIVKYGEELVSRYYDVIDELINDELLEDEGVLMIRVKEAVKPIAKTIRLTHKGIDLSNQVMAKFLLD